MNRYSKIFISGHRNPDVDTVTSAYALAELRRKTGMENVTALCPGKLPERAKWVFDHFGVTPPVSRTDVYLRVSDIMTAPFAALAASICLSINHLQSGTEVSDADKLVDWSLNVSQSAKTGLRMTMTIIPIIGLAAAFLWFRRRYILTDEKVGEIAAQVKQRNNKD